MIMIHGDMVFAKPTHAGIHSSVQRQTSLEERSIFRSSRAVPCLFWLNGKRVYNNVVKWPLSLSSPRVRTTFSFLVTIPIGLVGGLIGLGGAEYRLPVLAGLLGFSIRRAIPLNLAISLVTVLIALGARQRSLTFVQLAAIIPVIVSMAIGAVAAAYVGAAWSRHLDSRRLKLVVVVLLAAIGLLLIIEASLPAGLPGLLPAKVSWQYVGGVVLGVLVGLFSSLLGVAGGELILPSLIFVFGVDAKTAGSASLFISIPTMIMGLARYAVQGGIEQRSDLVETVLPMSLGSAIGATIGGLLVGLVPSVWLKILLGIILLGSAALIQGGREMEDKRNGRNS